MIVRVLLGIWGACALVLAQNTPAGGDPSTAQPAEVARLTGKYTSPLVLAPTAEGGVIAPGVDAALDEANVGRFSSALRGLAKEIQFIVITHNRGTIEAADALYGVTVGDDAVSRVISLRLGDRESDAEASA